MDLVKDNEDPVVVEELPERLFTVIHGLIGVRSAHCPELTIQTPA
jgi:hypothetical protein